MSRSLCMPSLVITRSEAVFFVASSLVRAGCSDDEIANVLMDSDCGISATFATKASRANTR